MDWHIYVIIVILGVMNARIHTQVVEKLVEVPQASALAALVAF
jgi:hypothetical protein